MNLREAIAGDPLLKWRASELDATRRDAIRAHMTGVSTLYREVEPHRHLAPEAQYAGLIVWTLNALAAHFRDVPVVGLALACDAALEPHDEPGQGEYRAVVTREWLRARLGADRSN